MVSPMSPPYSPEKFIAPEMGGLEVVDRSDVLPQVVEGFKMKPPDTDGDRPGAGEEKKICGLRRTTFILAVVLALVIVAAAVGGGVGGSTAVSRAYE